MESRLSLRIATGVAAMMIIALVVALAAFWPSLFTGRGKQER